MTDRTRHVAVAPNPAWSPIVVTSIGCHAAAATILLAAPTAWPWAVALLAANHGVLSFAGLWPRSRLLGPNLTRLPPAAAAIGAVAITIDDGPDPAVTPQVLALLRTAGARATFFCIGDRAQHHPDLVRAMVAGGHSVQNHTQHHTHRFSFFGPTGYARDIDAAQTTLTRLCGVPPMFVRAPAGLRNPFLGPVLARRGLRLASWTRRGYDTRERDPGRVLRRLTRQLSAGDILLLHDGHAARTPAGTPVVLEVLPALLHRIREAGLHTVTLPEALSIRQGATLPHSLSARQEATRLDALVDGHGHRHGHGHP